LRSGPCLVPAARLLPPETPVDVAIDRFLAEFGASRDAPVVFADAAGAPVLISDAFFRTRTKQAKERLKERVADMLLLADTLRDPDEIWLVWYAIRDASGAVMYQLRRRYLRRVLLDGAAGPRPGFVIAEWGRMGWTGTTAYRPGADGYLERQRVGERVFVREN